MKSYIASVYFASASTDQATLVATVHIPQTPAALFDVHAAITTGKLYDGGAAHIVPKGYNVPSLARRGFRYGDFIRIAGKDYTYCAEEGWKLDD